MSVDFIFYNFRFDESSFGGTKGAAETLINIL
jgi:hypothetical protein